MWVISIESWLHGFDNKIIRPNRNLTEDQIYLHFMVYNPWRPMRCPSVFDNTLMTIHMFSHTGSQALGAKWNRENEVELGCDHRLDIHVNGPLSALVGVTVCYCMSLSYCNRGPPLFFRCAVEIGLWKWPLDSIISLRKVCWIFHGYILSNRSYCKWLQEKF